jgi:hypothetical protein
LQLPQPQKKSSREHLDQPAVKFGWRAYAERRRLQQTATVARRRRKRRLPKE